MKSKDQSLLTEVYYHVLEQRAIKTFEELTALFKKLTGKENPQPGDEYIYEYNDSIYKIVKQKDGLYWGRWWQGQLWGRFINQYSTSNVKDNESLVELLKTKSIRELEKKLPELKGMF
jgi:hypothetical protein